MSIKHCDHHKDCDRQRLYRRCCAAVVAIILLLLLIVLIVWLVLRPTKPYFSLNDVVVSCFNVTAGASSYGASYLTVTMQATIAARNPNDRVGIFYDRTAAFGEYKGLQITVPTALPVIYQGHLDTSIWSPFLSGADVPLPPNLAVSITQGKAAGYILVTVRVEGWIRWKAGAFITGHYHLRARCPALLTINAAADQGGYGYNSGAGGSVFTFQRPAPCVVDV